MTVDNPIKYEVELVERLWSQGFAAFRTNAQAPGALAGTDVLALKDGNAYVFNVVVLTSGAGGRSQHEESDEMSQIVSRARSNSIHQQDGLKIGHAIKKEFEGEWYFADYSMPRIRASTDYKTLNEALDI